MLIGENNDGYRAAFELSHGTMFQAAWANHCGKLGTVVGEGKDTLSVMIDGVLGTALHYPTQVCHAMSADGDGDAAAGNE